MKKLDSLPDDAGDLFPHALQLVRGFADGGVSDPFWTFGGGTVLMLRYGHRKSKDIDIFVPDAQYLGYVTPRLSTVAENITRNYVETAGYVKLVLAKGEIDFVAAPNLTPVPFEVWEISGEPVRVETAAEILAKKMWHRGDKTTARDLFDLAMIAELAPDQLAVAMPWTERHRVEFLSQVVERRTILAAQFAQIDTLGFKRGFDECVEIAHEALGVAPTPEPRKPKFR